MIPAQDIVNSMKSMLDAEGADYYTFNLDYAPAVNYSVRWLESVINSAYGEKKLGEEIFQDLIFTRVFQTSQFSRIVLDSTVLGHDIWTLLSIEPLPETYPSSAISPATPTQSIYRNDISHVNSNYYAHRLTLEEWNKNKNNPFAEGHTAEAGETSRSYAYINFNNYTSAGYVIGVATKHEIEIRPVLNKQLCTIRYAKRPATITLISDNIEFPTSLFNLIVSKAINFIGYKMGDNTTITNVSNQDISVLLQSIQ